MCLTTRAERLPLKIYTTADGLAHNEINKIVRDSRGFLWFCTANGLSRFDGYTFTNYGTEQGLPHVNVTDFLEARSGELWVATSGGLVRFKPKGAPQARVVYEKEVGAPAPMFTVIIPDDDDRRAKAISVLLEDHNGTIWCGTLKGLYRLERNDTHPALRPVDIGIPNEYPEQRFISDVLEDRHGSIWIAAGFLYRRWPDGRTARYFKLDDLPLGGLNDLFEDHLGRLWAGTRNHGFFQFVADDANVPPRIVRRYAMRDGLLTDWVFQIFETSDHRYWLGTNLGLVNFFPDGEPGKQFLSYTTQNGLSFREIIALNEDAGGNLWLASVAGAMKLAHEGFVTYGEQDGLVSANAIFEDSSGAVCFRGWVLGDRDTSVFEGAKLDLFHRQANSLERLGRFDGQRFSWFFPSALRHSSYLGWVGEGLTLLARNHEWWIGTAVGLYRFPASDDFTQLKTARPLAIYTTRDGLAASQVYRLFEDSRGGIWISTTGYATSGLARWERPSGTVRDLAGTSGLPSFKDDLARSFGEDRAGNVWIGFGAGLARYRDERFTFFTTNDGLPPGAIQFIYLDDAGRLWLASSRSGLVRVNDPSAERPIFINYTTAQGLSGNLTEVITGDSGGLVYVGTGSGVDQLDPVSGRVKHFTTADGLASGPLRAAFRDRSGALWFGTAKGLSRFVPGREARSAPPPILISGLRVSGSPRLVSALGETEMFVPDLAANQNELQINFVGLSFAPGEVLRYQHKLDGTGGDWSAPTDERSVNYGNLAPDRYRFLVRAVNSDGVNSTQPAVVTFRILPPIWQRWWFFTLAAFAVGMSAYLAYRYRVARLLEVAQMRTRIATDLHDDIGANLTRIAILSEVAKQQFGNGDELKANPLSSIADIARESVASMSDIVWAIDPERDNLHDLTRKMRQHADEVFTLRDIDLDFRAPTPDQNPKLGVDVRRDLLLIFKEAVNNAARHSRCSRVTVEFRADNSSLSLEVTDDGVGFDASIRSEGQGLISMRRRAQKLGGLMEIAAHPNRGTSIKAFIPLSRAPKG